ncbi:MAG: terminase large subunit [Cloacibacillus sp.]
MSNGCWIREYNAQIQSGQIVACLKIKALYKKLVYDLDHQTRWIFDDKKGQRVIDFIEIFCRQSKGKCGRQYIKLELWQKALISAAFGFVDDDGKRRFQELVVIVARKNGKSLIGSALANYMLFADGENGPEIVSAATQQKQAKIIWDEAKKMILKSPELMKKCRALVGEIITDFNDGSFRPVSSESKHLDGLNLHAFTLD